MENRLQPTQLVTPPASPTIGSTETNENQNLEVTDTPEPREMMPELATAFAPPPYSSSPRTRNPTARWAPYSVASGIIPAASCLTSARVNPRRGIRPSSPTRPAGGNRPGLRPGRPSVRRRREEDWLVTLPETRRARPPVACLGRGSRPVPAS